MELVLAFIVVCFCVLRVLHVQTHGRSSPVAALTFFLGGPVLGIVLLVGQAIRVANQEATLGAYAADQSGSQHGAGYVIVLPLLSLGAAVIVAAIYAIGVGSSYDVRRAETLSSAPRPVASAALEALGLRAAATLDDVERAYRERAMELSDDAAAMARLEGTYGRAKDFVQRREARPGRAMRGDG